MSSNDKTTGKAQPKVQKKLNQLNKKVDKILNENKKKGRGRRNRMRRRRRLPRVRNVEGTYLVTRTLRNSELWQVSNFVQDSPGTVVQVQFDSTNFPPWFDKARKLYEMYQLHYIRIYTKSSAATTTSGSYVLSYNTNKAQSTDNTRTLAKLAAQQNAQQGRVYSNLSVVIPASALKNFRTNTPTDGADSWSFNVELGMTGNSAALSVPIWIEYVVTFRNPQV